VPLLAPCETFQVAVKQLHPKVPGDMQREFTLQVCAVVSEERGHSMLHYEKLDLLQHKWLAGLA